MSPLVALTHSRLIIIDVGGQVIEFLNLSNSAGYLLTSEWLLKGV